MKRGFIFSFESAISLLIFTLIILSIPLPATNSFEELILLQQENDLLKLWAKDFSIEEMKNDLRVFEEASLFIDGKEVISANGKEGVASEAILLDDNLKESKVRIIVYYN
jgi:hypothetical protein